MSDRPRYTLTFGYALPPGLYEISEHGACRYLLVWSKPAGLCAPPADRVEQMAKLMADGQEFEVARLATRKGCDAKNLG